MAMAGPPGVGVGVIVGVGVGLGVRVGLGVGWPSCTDGVMAVAKTTTEGGVVVAVGVALGCFASATGVGCGMAHVQIAQPANPTQTASIIKYLAASPKRLPRR
jgi:hypothetical protein